MLQRYAARSFCRVQSRMLARPLRLWVGLSSAALSSLRPRSATKRGYVHALKANVERGVVEECYARMNLSRKADFRPIMVALS